MLTTPRRLEEILVEAGIATALDLERARRRMRERGGRLVANLAALGRWQDDELAQALGKALGVPVIDRARLSRVAAPRTPSRRAALRALAIERVLMPIGATREPRCVEVAMFDPTDSEAVERLRAICGGVSVTIAVAPRRALLDAIAQVYGREQAGVLGGGPSDGNAPEVLPENLELIDDSDDDAAAGAGHHGRGGTGVEIASDMAEDIGRLGDPDAPTPPPVLLTTTRDSRFTRVLLEAVGLLADLLEERTAHRPGTGRDLARYSRLVARHLGCAPSVVDEIGLAAHLHGVDRALREAARAGRERAPDLANGLGWAAGQPDGAAPILRALAAVADGFPAPQGDAAVGDTPLGAQIIGAVVEYLALVHATPDGVPDRATMSQLLRVTTPPEIIEALGRVLDAERSHAISTGTTDHRD